MLVDWLLWSSLLLISVTAHYSTFVHPAIAPAIRLEHDRVRVPQRTVGDGRTLEADSHAPRRQDAFHRVMGSMIGRMHHVVVDCPGPAAVAGFYSALPGLPMTYRDDGLGGGRCQ
jgi:hypothetical protein